MIDKTPHILLTITVIMLTLLLLSACNPKVLKKENEYLNTYYQDKPIPTAHQVQLTQGLLSMVDVGNPDKPTIIFIHGTPGNWSFFTSYLHHPTLLKNTHMIAIDRPGWGKSRFNDDVDRSYTLDEQSDYLGTWLCEKAQQSPTNKVILVGHSYGATVAPQLAMDYPDCVSAMLLLAGPADPNLSNPRWYNRLTTTWAIGGLVKRMVPDLKDSNREMMPLSKSLKQMQDRWQNIKQPTVVIQGGKDFLVKKGNADFIQKYLINAPVKIIRRPDQGHFVVFENKDLVVDELIKLIDRLD